MAPLYFCCCGQCERQIDFVHEYAPKRQRHIRNVIDAVVVAPGSVVQISPTEASTCDYLVFPVYVGNAAEEI